MTTIWMMTRFSHLVFIVDVLNFIWIGMKLFTSVLTVMNPLTQIRVTMEKKKNPKKELKNLKEKSKPLDWKINYSNTSDIGYPEKDTYLSEN